MLRDDPEIGPGKPCSLQGLGIEETQSHRWQRIADIDEADFEAVLAAAEPCCACLRMGSGRSGVTGRSQSDVLSVTRWSAIFDPHCVLNTVSQSRLEPANNTEADG